MYVTDISVTNTGTSGSNSQMLILISPDAQKELSRPLLIYCNVAQGRNEEPEDLVTLLRAQIIQEDIRRNE